MYRLLLSIEKFLSPFFLFCMTVIIIFQVLNRYILTYSLDWPEELGRYLFIFAVYQGASYAEQQNRHLEITIMRTLFDGRYNHLLLIISKACSLAFCCVMTYWGAKMVLFVHTSNQLAPSLQIPMYLIYLCIPIGMFSMAVHTGLNLYRLICPDDSSDAPTP